VDSSVYVTALRHLVGPRWSFNTWQEKHDGAKLPGSGTGDRPSYRRATTLSLTMQVHPPRDHALYHVEFGLRGPTLVFLPGVGGTTRYWASRIAPLAVSHRLVLVDLLGFGRSPKPWTTYTIERHVTELHRVLANRGPVTLVGHSFGALAAVAYAARHPEQVGALILLSLPNFGGEERAMDYFRARPTADRWLMTNVVLASVACIVTRRLMRRLLPRLAPDMPREILEDYVLHTWRSATSTMWEGVYRYDLTDDTAALPDTLPVLLLHGEHDTTAPLEGVARLQDAYPGWTLRVLLDGDHHPLLRDPEWTVREVQTFLAKTEARPVAGQTGITCDLLTK
jgi:pimeloyl-ACP methyl ester carboxylesterase